MLKSMSCARFYFFDRSSCSFWSSVPFMMESDPTKIDMDFLLSCAAAAAAAACGVASLAGASCRFGQEFVQGAGDSSHTLNEGHRGIFKNHILSSWAWSYLECFLFFFSSCRTLSRSSLKLRNGEDQKVPQGPTGPAFI